MKQNWEYKKLGEICEIIGRIGFRGYTRNDLVEEGKGAISLSPSNIVDGKISFDGKVSYLSWEKYYESPEIMLEVNDVVFTKTASVGKCALVKYLPTETTLNPQLVVLKKIKCKPSYLTYILQGRKFQESVLSQKSGTSIPTVSQAFLGNLIVPIAPLSEQERIVKELDLLLGIIEKQKQQLKELDILSQSIFYSMFGDPVSNDKNWEVKKLNETAPQQSYKGEIQSFNKKFWLLNLDKVESKTGKILSYDYFDMKEIGNSTIKFDETNILYSKLRPYLNKVVIPNKQGFATTELIPLKPNPEIINRIFFAHLLRSKSFVSHISEKVAGAKMPRVSMEDLRSFLVITPPLSLQNSFAGKIEKIEKQKEAINKSIEETQKLFDYTMDKYFG